MDKSEFSFNMTISKSGKFYKNFYMPITTNDIIFSDLFEGYIIAGGRESLNSLTTSSTLSPFSVTINVPPMGIGESVEVTEFPTLYPKLKID